MNKEGCAVLSLKFMYSRDNTVLLNSDAMHLRVCRAGNVLDFSIIQKAQVYVCNFN